MAKKGDKKIKGDLIFDKLDGAKARFKIKDADQLMQKNIDIETDIFPEAFELADYAVTGSISVSVNFKKIKK